MATDVTGAAPFGLGCPATFATGAFTSDGNATSIVVGFLPRSVKVVDETGGIVWEKLQGMAPQNTVKSGAIDATTAISFPTDPGLNEPGNTVLLSAGLCGTGKKLSWSVLG